MARRLANAIAAKHDDVQLIDGSGTRALQATSPAPNSYAPPSGAQNWITIEGGGSNTIKGITDFTANPYAVDTEMSLAYLPFTFLIDGTLSPSQSGRVLIFLIRPDGGGSLVIWNLEWVYVSGTTFNLRLTNAGATRTVKATGSTVFTTLEIVHGRITVDGTNITVHAQENDSDLSGLAADMQVAETRLITNNRNLEVVNVDDLDAGEYVYLDCYSVIAADSTSDRPNAGCVLNRVDGDGEGSAQDYGDDAVCGSTDAVHADVALDGSDQADTSIYWCERGVQNGSQEQTLAAFTPAGKLAGITIHSLITANLESKTLNTWTRYFDASSTGEWTNASVAVTDWVPKIACPELDPSGGEWEDLANLNAIGTGGRSVSTNGAEDHWAAQFIQTYEYPDDAPATPRSGVALGSANAMIL